MTAIAGVVDKGKVWIGGDSAGVGGYSIAVRSDPKVFVKGEFAFGYTSSFRMGQLIEFEFHPPKALENQSGIEYMVCQFIPELKRVFKSGGFARNENSQELGGQFLVGWRGELYDVEDDFQVGRVANGFYACGCGQDLVLGSLHATSKLKMKPKDRILLALAAAESFSAGVRGPHHVVCV